MRAISPKWAACAFFKCPCLAQNQVTKAQSSHSQASHLMPTWRCPLPMPPGLEANWPTLQHAPPSAFGNRWTCPPVPGEEEMTELQLKSTARYWNLWYELTKLLTPQYQTHQTSLVFAIFCLCYFSNNCRTIDASEDQKLESEKGWSPPSHRCSCWSVPGNMAPVFRQNRRRGT